MSKFDLLYHKLPVWAQHGAVSAYGLYWYWLRFGGGYRNALDGYLRRERLTADEWRTWQRERLKNLVASCAQDVVFYRNNWSASEKKAAGAGRLEDLPLLEKDAVREDPHAFLRPDVQRPLVFHTSGSTGTPVASMWTVVEMRNSMAVREARSALWANVSFRMPRATFSGRLIVPDPQSDGPFYRYNVIEKQAYFSAFHLRPDTAQHYVAALSRHNVQWLTGYAVSYYLLAKFILDQRLPVPALRAVVTTSEKVTDEMRRVMESAYDCPVYEEYSTVENVLFASECEQRRLHVSPDIGVVEILRPDGSPCAPGETGEVVATGLMRWSQPLIRYRLGDLASWDEEPCLCGRAMPVIKEVVGRIEDVVVGLDGRQLVRFHGVFVDQPHVREGQIIQEALNRIRVRIAPSNGFGEDDVADIVRRVRQRLGEETEVIVEQVNEIPRTKSGKFQAVISLVGRREGVGSGEWGVGGREGVGSGELGVGGRKGVGSGELGVGRSAFSPLPIPHSPLPTPIPHSPFPTPHSPFPTPPFVSVIMPVRNESGYIKRSLAAVFAQDYPADSFEVIVADGMSSDGTREIVREWQAQRPNLKMIDNHGMIAPTGLNAAIERARGEIIIRVDGHCEIAPDYISKCVEHLQNDEVDGVGGPLETIGETASARVIAEAMSCGFGVGGSAFRAVKGKTMLTDTVAFPAYTRAAIERAGLFDEELVRNQDDEYNYRLRKLGAKILLASDVRARYYSRGDIRSLIRQYFQYGYWKVRVLQKHPRQMSPRQFVPPLFVASLPATALLALILSFSALGPLAWALPAIVCGCYIIANLVASARLAWKIGWPHSFLLPPVFASLHVSYGLGFLLGLIKFAPRWWESEIHTPLNPGDLYIHQQRQRGVLTLLRSERVFPFSGKRVLEVGCGSGKLLREFLWFGAPHETLFGVELSDKRLKEAQAFVPHLSLINADGQSLPFDDDCFDLVIQFTTFSSVLDDDVRRRIAAEMRRVLRPNGLLLWYDFWLNPINPQTRGISPDEIRDLFPGSRYSFRRMTLAPPVARLLAPHSWLTCYLLESLRVFNTHYLAVIRPDKPLTVKRMGEDPEA